MTFKWFERILKRQPKVAVTEVSELYRNKGTNRYYRAYVEVQKVNIKENQKQLKELTLFLRRSNEQESDVRTFIREIRQYATIQELGEGILNRLISRILVGEVKKIDGEKFQEIKIIYNFFGEIPAEQYVPKGEEYRKIYHGNYNHYGDFIELLAKLKPPLDKRFIEIMDEQLDIIPYEFPEMFIDSYKLGAKMMAEVFRNE